VEQDQSDALQTVFLDQSLPLEVRYLAIIQLKNGIDKYWRKTATKYASTYSRMDIHTDTVTAL
jgi:hypothetical protein